MNKLLAWWRSLAAEQFSFRALARRLQPAFERLLAIADARFSAFIQPRRKKGEIIIEAYVGWGTPRLLELSGRVLLPRTLPAPRRGDARWRNFRSIVRRLLSREVGGVTVRGVLEGQMVSAESDVGGFFKLVWERGPGAAVSRPADGWLEAALFIEGRRKTTFAPIRVVDHPRFAIISDLDDTVIKSDVTSLPQMLGTVLTGNARTRLPFPGVSALYRALVRERGTDNPIFYVSSSPWNFFDLLWTFLRYRRLPLGPLLLRDWGSELFSGSGHHKHAVIDRLFQTYPALSFVLIGDSGEQDPEIYAEVVRRYPGRVLAVYIRKVSGAARDEGVQQLRTELLRAGVRSGAGPRFAGGGVSRHGAGPDLAGRTAGRHSVAGKVVCAERPVGPRRSSPARPQQASQRCAKLTGLPGTGRAHSARPQTSEPPRAGRRTPQLSSQDSRAPAQAAPSPETGAKCRERNRSAQRPPPTKRRRPSRCLFPGPLRPSRAAKAISRPPLEQPRAARARPPPPPQPRLNPSAPNRFFPPRL